MKDTNATTEKDSAAAHTERRTDGGRTMAAIAARDAATEGEAVYERGFDEAASTADTCPECSGRLRTDTHERVCTECGLVVDDEQIDHGPEWRDFSAEDSGCRVGSPNTVARHDRGIGSEIGWDHVDRTARMGRLRREHRRSKTRSKRERNQRLGFIEIRRMAGALGLGETLRDQSCKLFRSVQTKGLLVGRSIEAMASACLYAVCRLNKQPRPLGDIEAVSKLARGRIERSYAVLNRELALPVPPATPKQYVRQVASTVGLDAEAVRRARDLLEAGTLPDGVHPAGAAAGALYLVGRRLDAAVSQAALADAADVTPMTVRKRYQELRKAE